jgi:hypothetical protein
LLMLRYWCHYYFHWYFITCHYYFAYYCHILLILLIIAIHYAITPFFAIIISYFSLFH